MVLGLGPFDCWAWTWAHLTVGLGLGLMCLVDSGSSSLVWQVQTHYFFGPILNQVLELSWIRENLTTKIQSNYNHHNFVMITWHDLIYQNFLFNKCPFSRFMHMYGWMNLENDKMKPKIQVICS